MNFITSMNIIKLFASHFLYIWCTCDKMYTNTQIKSACIKYSCCWIHEQCTCTCMYVHTQVKCIHVYIQDMWMCVCTKFACHSINFSLLIIHLSRWFIWFLDFLCCRLLVTGAFPLSTFLPLLSRMTTSSSDGSLQELAASKSVHKKLQVTQCHDLFNVVHYCTLTFRNVLLILRVTFWMITVRHFFNLRTCTGLMSVYGSVVNKFMASVCSHHQWTHQLKWTFLMFSLLCYSLQ